MSRTEHPTLADARAKLLDYINRHLTLRGFSTSSRALHEFLTVFEAGVRDDEREILGLSRVVSAPADVSFVPSLPGQEPLVFTNTEQVRAGEVEATIGVDLSASEVSSAPFEDSLHIQSLLDEDDQRGADLVVDSK